MCSHGPQLVHQLTEWMAMGDGLQVLEMPSLSPTMTMGNVASWQKKEGDKVCGQFAPEH